MASWNKKIPFGNTIFRFHVKLAECKHMGSEGKKQQCEPRKKPSDFPLYWLFNRDPYNGLLQSPYNYVV